MNQLVADTALFRITAELAPPVEVGDTPLGRRRLIAIIGGRVEGPRLAGRILAGGADWQLVRPDGVADIAARYTIETADGDLVAVTSEGLRHGPPEVMELLARGERVDPARYFFRTLMRFESAPGPTAWLNRVMAIGRGRRDPAAVVIDVHEIL